jgi:DNA-binding transcriptional ArsR family regulator
MNSSIYKVKAELFKTLAHPARIRILELLRDGERSVSELLPEVGLESSHLSQQLGVLRRANLVNTRKQASTVFYAVNDRRIFDLLEAAKQLLTGSLTETQGLLAELDRLDFGRRPDRIRQRTAERSR